MSVSFCGQTEDDLVVFVVMLVKRVAVVIVLALAVAGLELGPLRRSPGADHFVGQHNCTTACDRDHVSSVSRQQTRE